MIDWKPGDKVVCVDDDWGLKHSTRIDPRLGEKYTIRTIGPGVLCPHSENYIYIRLEEIINAAVAGPNRNFEPQFLAAMFRKVQPSQSSIDALARLTNSIPGFSPVP